MSKIQEFRLKEFEKLKAILNQKMPPWSKNLGRVEYAVSLKFLPRALIRTKIASYFVPPIWTY